MTIQDEVLAFARDYINNPRSRSADRKAKIKQAYLQTFGKLFNVKCGTCYIAALIKLVNLSKHKIVIPKIMAQCDYQLKPGAILQAFGHREKNVFNNNQLTNALAEWHLKNNPACVVKFARMPNVVKDAENVEVITPLKIVPVKEEVIEEVKPIEEELPEEVIPEAKADEEVKEIPVKTPRKRTPKTKK